jgi:hypothetical protein
MAGIALGRRRNVIDVLSRSTRAVVARGATAEHLCMIDARYRAPRRRGMAGFAIRSRENMSGVLAGRSRSVVATCTVGGNAGV